MRDRPGLLDVGPVERAGPGPGLLDVGPVERAGPGPGLLDVGPVERAGSGPGAPGRVSNALGEPGVRGTDKPSQDRPVGP